MSTPSRSNGLFSRLRARLSDGLRTDPLARCNQVGVQPELVGTLHVENDGRIQIGDHFRVASVPVQTHLVVHRGATLRIGNRVSMAHGCGIACHSRIEIGDDTALGAFVMLLDTDYHVAGDPTQLAEPLPIRIGRRVRIGSHVNVLRGTVIEDDAVVASGSVVSGFVAASSSVAGVPARAVGSPRLSLLPPSLRNSLESRVAEVAMHTFRLSELPDLGDGPAQIPHWDSLGALSLLVALEEEFGVTLAQDDTAGAKRLRDFAALIARMQARTGAPLP
jgi:acetyltransferase-like isoleucine patch superfamily enzyme